MKKRVYVAGPISIGDLKFNLRQATDAGMKLLKAGLAPFVPHLTCFMCNDYPEVLPGVTKAEDWYGIDLPWVAVADAVVRLPGLSVGADMEVGQAILMDIPVFGSAEECIAYFECLAEGKPCPMDLIES